MLLLRYSSIRTANIRIPNRNVAIGRTRFLFAKDRAILLTARGGVAQEGEVNHSTSVISRLGLVGGGGAVVMV